MSDSSVDTTQLTPTERNLLGVGRASAKSWWLVVLVGVLWMIYAFVVLSITASSVWAITVMFGIGFIGGGLFEFALAGSGAGYRWMHIIFGVLSIIAGIVAFVWPGQTFVALAAIIAWYMLFDGTFSAIIAVSTRRMNDLWWAGLLVALIEIGIGFWAIGYSGRSTALLVAWVGAAALVRGITLILSGLSLHGADREFERLLTGTSSASS